MTCRVAVIILNWNGENLLKEFLPSVVEYTKQPLANVFVADNGSDDASLQLLKEEFPQVEVISFDKNNGFASGYNKAIEFVEAEYVLLLNSDVEVTSGWLEPLVRLLDKEKTVAAVQPKIRSFREREKFEYAGACGGYIDRWGFPFCRGRMVNVTEEDKGQYDDQAEIFWASGAAMCVRREVYLSCGGLDETFFAHMEEIDLCWRMRNQGYTLKVCPESTVYHLGGGSLPMHHPQKLFLNYRNNLLMLYKNLYKHECTKVFSMRCLLDLGACAVFTLKGEFRNVASVFRAYRSFLKEKKHYAPDNVQRKDKCIYQKSILYQFYLKKIRLFSALTWNIDRMD